MAVRERRTENAVLKTLGFSSGFVMALIFREALGLGIFCGGLGGFFSHWGIKALPSLPFILVAVGWVPDLGLVPQVAGLGFGVALFLGLAAGFVPAFLAYRARITEMLRQV